MVNKLDTIDTEFRVFKMEVLAGDDDFVAEMVSPTTPLETAPKLTTPSIDDTEGIGL